MNITEIRLFDYRNYQQCSVELGERLNVFVGRNAMGKTNLLESVYLSGVGRSARTPRDRELIRWGANEARVYIEVAKKSGTETVDIHISAQDKKRVLINGAPILRIGELMGAVSVIYFSPDELRLVKEGPSERRRFMDIDISQLSRAYFYSLLNYNNILAQRNKLLKNLKDLDTLEIWDGELAKEGARIVKARRGFTARLKPHAHAAHLYLTQGKEGLTVDYTCSDADTVADIAAELKEELVKSRERDVAHGYTHVGPHKDDFKLFSESGQGKLDLRSYGSQGQQRTAALSLKLAELEIFAEVIGEYPVLLLDDVLSELDPVRRRLLLDKVNSIQTIITATDILEDLGNAKRFSVENGLIVSD